LVVPGTGNKRYRQVPAAIIILQYGVNAYLLGPKLLAVEKTDGRSTYCTIIVQQNGTHAGKGQASVVTHSASCCRIIAQQLMFFSEITEYFFRIYPLGTSCSYLLYSSNAH
jgi:hypothetical protein